jgi:hypothetical protein
MPERPLHPGPHRREPREDPLSYVGVLSRVVVLTTSIAAVVVALVLLVVVLT